MNTTIDLSQERWEKMIESPIPISHRQDHLRLLNNALRTPVEDVSEFDDMKARTPVVHPSMRPQPLASSSNYAANAPSSHATMPISPVTCISSITDPSISHHPSGEYMVESPVNTVSPLSTQYIQSPLQGSAAFRPRQASSVYSQNTMANFRPPRPASSVYTLTSGPMISTTAASSPRTPTTTDWASIIPSLTQGNFGNPYLQANSIMRMESVKEEPSTPQLIESQIELPRMRSASRQRGLRPKMPTPINTHVGVQRMVLGGRPLVQSPERVAHQDFVAADGVDYEGRSWELQRPSEIHTAPETMRYVHRSQTADPNGILLGATPESRSAMVTSTLSFSSSLTQIEPPDRYGLRSHESMVDSRTPLNGVAEQQQRSGWWSEEEDEEWGAAGSTRGKDVFVLELKEKDAARRKKTKIILGSTILAIIIIIVVAVGVAVGVARRG